jgi:serine phosphatase RsbU (regulator of sigma subunit)
MLRAIFKIHIFLFLLFPVFVFSQKGNYFIHNYLPAQYNASDQNRCILQDFYGRVFVANNNGLLINNGADWDRLDLPFFCLSLGKDENEQLFVGGDGDFGKLLQLPNGSFHFESLTNLLPESERELNKFWTIICLKNHVYFCSNQKILDYDYKSIKAIYPGEEGFHTFFKVGGHLITRERGKGLKILWYNNELVFIKGGEIFADNDNPVRGIIKGDKFHYIVTPKKIYEFDFNKSLPELASLKPVNTPIESWLSEKVVYCAANIGADNFAFGSVNGGLLITDKKFKPQKYINSASELQDDGVNYIYNDNQGHIWLALAKGVTLIEFNSPITYFTKSDGVKGTVEACTFYNGIPYLATDKGILKYDPASLKFVDANVSEASWCLASVNDKLLAGTRSGIHVFENGNFNLIYETPGAAHCIYVDKGGMIYIGTETGYCAGKLENRSFIPVQEDFEMDADIRTITSDDRGSIYFGTTASGVLVKEKGSDEIVPVTDKQGLPSLNENYIFHHREDILVATDNGIYKIIKAGNSYKALPDKRFPLLLNRHIVAKAISIHNEIWLTAKPKNNPKVSESLMLFEEKNNIFSPKPSQLSRIKESDAKSFCNNDTLVYIGTNNGLYCYDVTLKPSRYGLNTFINAVIFGKDSSMTYFNLHPRTKLDQIELPYSNNWVQFNLGASDYIDKNELLFSYYLAGRDTSYGPYLNEKIKKYDYLHEGTYTFYVRSKNILGVEGQEIRITFKVLPPWYRTVWAYTVYGLLILLLVYIIIKLNSKRLIEQNIKLENIIAERTKEINKQKLLIQHKNQEITDSINYAKGIQDSILPGISEIKKVWSDLFIFFQPKDIVSGDFYWFKPINQDEFLIACADCTGHGVPGGFMSMICSDKLNDATRESTEPDRILFLANNSIKESLRQQSEGKSKDGMEIALVKVNTKTREVKYSGANRQMWIFSSASGTMNEIKPTKASIASFTEFNFTYDLNELRLEKGDVLYLTTDGYPDQFGGPAGKKYMTKNLKSFLAGISSMKADVQEQQVRTNIREWMQDYEQVDDLLVIGIRL